MTEPCAECARSAIFVHTAEVERDHSQRVIAALQAKVAELQQTIETLQKRKK